MPNEHVWRETTEEGEKREVRGVKFAGRWRIQSKLRHDPDWTYHETPSMTDLESLRDLIFRKYQRRRAPYDDVQAIDRLIAEWRGKPAV